jgi:hypothetical protein
VQIAMAKHPFRHILDMLQMWLQVGLESRCLQKLRPSILSTMPKRLVTYTLQEPPGGYNLKS